MIHHSRSRLSAARCLALVVATASFFVGARAHAQVAPPDAKPSGTGEAQASTAGNPADADTKIPPGPTSPQTPSQTEAFKKVLPSVALVTVTEDGRGSHGRP